MRLVCPNCDAQYEVPSEVVPAAGRDVQCSNCGNTWFQRHPDDETDAASQGNPEDAADPAAEADDEAAQAVADAIAAEEVGEATASEKEFASEPDAAADPGASYDDSDDADDHAYDGDDDPDDDWDDDEDETWDGAAAGVAAGAAAVVATPRPLDAKVSSVLQEEAARDARMRQADTLESQPDLGLGEPPAPESEAQRRERESRERMAKMRGKPLPTVPSEVPGPATDPEAASGSRRDLLPDIEEINSSLRAQGEVEQVDDIQVWTDAKVQRRGFRLGFALMLVLTALLILLYGKSDWVIEHVPAARGAVEGFVDLANRFRVWVDARATDLLIWLNGFEGKE